MKDVMARIVHANGPADRLDAPGMDSSRDEHHRCFFGVMSDAVIDSELARALYASRGDLRRDLWAADAASTVQSEKRSGMRVGVVSDIHFDIRPAFADMGIADAIDSFTLSFEVGAQNPSEDSHRVALESLGVDAADALMVGDRAHPDGGAVEHGLNVLLLSPLKSPSHHREGRVLDVPRVAAA